jgi:hypothetical protein
MKLLQFVRKLIKKIKLLWSKAAKRINKLSDGFHLAKKELETLKNINSDYIVKYLDFDQDDTNLYVIMKLYEVISNYRNQFFLIFKIKFD